jgi:hypothetical protein
MADEDFEQLTTEHFPTLLKTYDLQDKSTAELRVNAKKNRYIVKCTVTTATATVITNYIEAHNDILATVPVTGRRNLVLVYDTRRGRFTDFMEVIQPFVRLHQGLKDVYADRLVCTMILVDNELISNVINFILTSLYSPTRPLRMITRNFKATMIELGVVKDVAVEGGYVAEKA